MSRNDFMKELEGLLQDISPAEREEALQYYNDYFDDAGPEKEQAVIDALGQPAKVAENIKKDLLANGYCDSISMQVTANDRAVIAYGEDIPGRKTEAPRVKETLAEWEAPKTDNATGNQMSTGLLVLIIVLCVLASPVLLGVISGILGTLIGIIATWFALILSFGVVAVALLAVFVVLAVVAVICIASEPLVSVALLGGGMVCAGIGLLFLMLTVAMAGIATPAIVRGTVVLCRKIFRKKEAIS